MNYYMGSCKGGEVCGTQIVYYRFQSKGRLPQGNSGETQSNLPRPAFLGLHSVSPSRELSVSSSHGSFIAFLSIIITCWSFFFFNLFYFLLAPS